MICTFCNIDKKLTEFHKDSESKIGYRKKCKICRKNNVKPINPIFKDNLKYCNKCKLYKEYSHYYECKNCPKGLRTYCKKCESGIYNLHKHEYSERSKKYREKNKEHLRKKAKEYYSNNIEKRKVYLKERMKNDHIFALKTTISKNINLKLRRFLKGNKEKNTMNILGCSSEYFAKHIESKFEKWMTWENRGLYNGELNYGWDLDHIIPLYSAKNDEEVYKLNHFSNFQPLCSKVNRDIKWKIIN